ncbi:MAG TPA: HU family DNA-binding protein [Gemmatimonadales bacterium]|nr:HU family DNA-binding protein [Gemmatimonadales bacterium]
MNKQELVQAVAEQNDLSKAEAGRILDSLFAPKGIIGTQLKKGNKVALPGFGVFQVKNRAARKGRNPQTGEAVKIRAAKVPSFRAGAGLKGLVNGKRK